MLKNFWIYFGGVVLASWLSSCGVKSEKVREVSLDKEVVAQPAKPTIDFPLRNHHSNYSEMVKLDTLIHRFMRYWDVQGLSLGIVKDGKLLYAKAYGEADTISHEKTAPYHLFRTASVSKLVTAVAIMKLVEAKKISLDQAVFGKKGILNDTTYLHYKSPNLLKIKVEHLLTHTGGWRNIYRTDPMFVPLAVAKRMQVKSPPSFETTLQFMLTQEVAFEPGKFYDYSNFGYCVLGKVVEKAAGMPYEKYVQQILKPLGIERMRLGKNRRQDQAFTEVSYYEHANAEKKLSCYNTGDSVARTYDATNIEALGPAGGWLATPTDLLRLVTAIDGFSTVPDFLTPASIKAMTTPRDSSEKKVLGWKACNAQRWWRTGSLAGTGIVVKRRQDGISYAIITNTSTWRGPGFSYELEGVMRRGIKTIKQWPKKDLFLVTDSTAVQ
ncbi:serine hydrolase [uncultured Microscilla sp.]|uniref:serine hydrolase domain-containing protein n=1 Tax=uncultured Microscilla sp. TaxID=432653 RepID=UPI00262D69B7|nr:serine hydrolase domain-containing protein [uncultured Microscilla sp.]